MLYIQLVFCRPQNYICQFFFWLHLKSFYVASSDFCAIVLNSRFKFLVSRKMNFQLHSERFISDFFVIVSDYLQEFLKFLVTLLKAGLRPNWA